MVTAAIPMENPHCRCKLTQDLRRRTGSWTTISNTGHATCLPLCAWRFEFGRCPVPLEALRTSTAQGKLAAVVSCPSSAFSTVSRPSFFPGFHSPPVSHLPSLLQLQPPDAT